MPDSLDTAASVWKSDQAISQWVSTSEERERKQAEPRRLMAELLPFEDDERFSFLDLGAGTGAAARAILDRYRESDAILADFSPQMMEEGQRVLAPYDGRYTYVELDLESGVWPDAIPATMSAVVSSLCVHHLPDERKRQLFSEILARLSPGGWYLNLDPVTSEDPGVETAWQRANDREDPQAAAKRANRTAYEQLRYEDHVRYMRPLAPQVEYLRAAGFEAVDVYWKRLEYVIYGGRRPLVAIP